LFRGINTIVPEPLGDGVVLGRERTTPIHGQFTPRHMNNVSPMEEKEASGVEQGSVQAIVAAKFPGPTSLLVKTKVRQPVWFCSEAINTSPWRLLPANVPSSGALIVAPSWTSS